MKKTILRRTARDLLFTVAIISIAAFSMHARAGEAVQEYDPYAGMESVCFNGEPECIVAE